VLNNKLQVAVNLAKRDWKGPVRCYMCDCLENIEHILFKCHLAKFVWEMFSEIFNLDSYPSSWDDFVVPG
jgi:hypothetical protein